MPIIERVMNKGFKAETPFSVFTIGTCLWKQQTTIKNQSKAVFHISWKKMRMRMGFFTLNKHLNRHRDGQVEFSGNLCYMILRHPVRGHFSPFVLSEIRSCDWLTQTGRALVGGHSRESELLLANSLPALQPNLPCRLETQALNLLLNLYLPFPHF